MLYWTEYLSPVGKLWLTADEHALKAVSLTCARSGIREETPLLIEALRQLDAYFAGTRTYFEIPLAPEGTAFQKRVWEALREIPYGETRTYGQIAQRVGSEKGFRAVGMANHRNPIMILIPCHRVIGADGSLTGYAGGLAVKEKLLRLEGAL